MSGHSKWTQIKHQKSATDQKRGKLFSILSKRLSIAAHNDPNPETNPALKMVVEKARAANMPKDTIERAIKRGSGAAQDALIEEAVYEAYGREGVQLVISATTDNRNRTSSDLRHILSKHNSSLSGSGSVLWNFERTHNAFIPKTMQIINKEAHAAAVALIEELRDNDDVEEVYTNTNLPLPPPS